MREIKFRAWHELEKEMIYPLARGFNQIVSNGDILDKYEIIMQYTGLKDKNGVEIYEGDIVKGWRTPDNFTGIKELGRPPYFEYREVKFTITETEVRLVLEKEGSYSERDKENNVLWEVVGNIYETPELLTP